MAAGSRRWVNLFLALFLPILAIDGFRPIGATHAWLEERIDYVLDVTGLWQGPWRLFGPDVDNMNLRLVAKLQFANGTSTEWRSPEWPEWSALRKFIGARHMNYFSNTLKAGQEPAWQGLCAYLGRTERPAGSTTRLASCELQLVGGVIPDPDVRVVPAEPYLVFDPPDVIYRWSAQ